MNFADCYSASDYKNVICPTLHIDTATNTLYMIDESGNVHTIEGVEYEPYKLVIKEELAEEEMVAVSDSEFKENLKSLIGL